MEQLADKAVQGQNRPEFLPLHGTDYVEFYVGNAKQSAYYYRAAFGMKLVAYRGPETGTRDRASYAVQQDQIRFVLTTPLYPDNAIAEHLKLHGDGVREIALSVDDAEAAYRETTRRGARGVLEPTLLEDEHGQVRISAIAAYGDTMHSFIERKNYRGVFLPGFRPVQSDDAIARPVGLKHIDHMVGNVGWGQMNAWVGFYRDILGFQLYQHFDDADISTEYSALMSKVMSNATAASSFRSMSRPLAGRSLRWRSFRSIITAQACSTSLWRRTTSSKPFPECPTRASNSSAFRRLTMPISKNALAGLTSQ